MWRKSTFSQSSDCLEIARDAHIILVRDSKRTSPVLRFIPSAWTAFITEVRK